MKSRQELLSIFGDFTRGQGYKSSRNENVFNFHCLTDILGVSWKNDNNFIRHSGTGRLAYLCRQLHNYSWIVKGCGLKHFVSLQCIKNAVPLYSRKYLTFGRRYINAINMKPTIIRHHQIMIMSFYTSKRN